jgi:YD repeat-containing protein
VVRARSSQGEDVAYEYDAGGRLARVSESKGVVRRYTYDGRGAMLTIDEPRWHIENRYDADGRCIHQVTRWPNGEKATLDVAYKVGKDGITETTTSWNDGSKTVYHFDDDHYVASKEFDPAGPAPVVILYRRNAGSNFPTGFSIRCYDGRG